MIVDNLSALHRCACGRLYKDFTGLAGQCCQCSSSVQDEYARQQAADRKRNDAKGGHS